MSQIPRIDDLARQILAQQSNPAMTLFGHQSRFDGSLPTLTAKPITQSHPWEQPWFAKAVAEDDARAESAAMARLRAPKEYQKAPAAAKPSKLPPGVIEMYSPESDFMEMVQVRQGSPEHIKMLRQAAQMEPGGPEAKELRKLGRK